MYLVSKYFKFYLLSTLRNTSSLFFTLIFPPLLFILSIQMWGTAASNQKLAYLTFANYSVQTVCFMVLGIGVSQEKNSNWSQYVRTLPARISTMVLGRILHTITLSLINIMVLTFVAVSFFHINLSFIEFSKILFICSFGAIPFALMGISVGYFANPDSARSIFTILNLLFLFGSFAGSANGRFHQIQKFILSYQWGILQKSTFDSTISVFGPILSIMSYICVSMFVLYMGLKKVRVSV